MDSKEYSLKLRNGNLILKRVDGKKEIGTIRLESGKCTLKKADGTTKSLDGKAVARDVNKILDHIRGLSSGKEKVKDASVGGKNKPSVVVNNHLPKHQCCHQGNHGEILEIFKEQRRLAEKQFKHQAKLMNQQLSILDSVIKQLGKPSEGKEKVGIGAPRVYRKAKESLEESRKDLEELKKEAEKKNKNIEDLQKNHGKLEEFVSSLEKQARETEAKMKNLARKNEQLESENLHLKLEKKIAGMVFEEEKTKILDLEQQLKTAQEKIEKLEKHIDDRAQQTEVSLLRASEQLNEARDKLVQMKLEQEDYDMKVNAAFIQIEKENNQYQEKIKLLEQNLQQAQEDLRFAEMKPVSALKELETHEIQPQPTLSVDVDSMLQAIQKGANFEETIETSLPTDKTLESATKRVKQLEREIQSLKEHNEIYARSVRMLEAENKAKDTKRLIEGFSGVKQNLEIAGLALELKIQEEEISSLKAELSKMEQALRTAEKLKAVYHKERSCFSDLYIQLQGLHTNLANEFSVKDREEILEEMNNSRRETHYKHYPEQKEQLEKSRNLMQSRVELRRQ
jgi:chromosome segregation ATPase